MTGAESRLFELVTGDQPITYRRLMREKTLDLAVRSAVAMARMQMWIKPICHASMSALSEDQLANVSRVGGEDLTRKP